MKPTLYLVVVGRYQETGDLAGVACTETDVLWHHTSSSESWLRSDLTEGFRDRRADLTARFPDGYEVDFIPFGAPLPVQIAHHFRPVTTSVTVTPPLGAG